MDYPNSIKRRRLVVGNWKMNLDLLKSQSLVTQIVKGVRVNNVSDIVVCPAYPYLHTVSMLLNGSHVMLGAQNVSEYQNGALTGEVSAQMLHDFSCRYVIIGHNERRRLQGESDQRVAEKFVASQANGLIPILCVGESLADREEGNYLRTIQQQLQHVIDVVGLSAFANAVVAYEPVWAVGTGKTATPDQAQEVHRFIRSQLGSLADDVRILYGGSVKPSNAQELFALEDVDGALLGGASLNAEEFITICEIASR